jgi:hypothetical protein
VRRMNKVFLVNNSLLNYDDFSFDRTILASEDLTHTKLLIDSVDEVAYLMQLIDNEYKVDKWKPPELDNKQQATVNLFANSKISDIINSIWIKATVIGLITLAIIIALIITYVIIHRNLSKCFKRHQKKNVSKIQEEEMEMKSWKLNKKQRKILKNLPSTKGDNDNFLELD